MSSRMLGHSSGAIMMVTMVELSDSSMFMRSRYVNSAETPLSAVLTALAFASRLRELATAFVACWRKKFEAPVS